MVCRLEMFYLNTIEQLFLFVEQLDQLEVCLPYSRLLTGIPLLAVCKNLRWKSNKTVKGRLIVNLRNAYFAKLAQKAKTLSLVFLGAIVS